MLIGFPYERECFYLGDEKYSHFDGKICKFLPVIATPVPSDLLYSHQI
jgi:hypothetical protein